MTMSNNGLNKLVEECGELVQVAGKLSAYPHPQVHPDGMGSLRARLMDECADVVAAIRFVSEKYEFAWDQEFVARCERKHRQFLMWDSDPEA
jgi:NTP pyrophosphatase (non-canonical NTP hydrolase)